MSDTDKQCLFFTPTHDLAIARAERDAWQSTCEELHRTIAGRDVEIESHLGRCEAADQRARSFEAALAAEREAGKGLVAQVEALRTESKHYTAIANHNAEIEAELAAIRDLVAPGNPQGTVVDAVRAMATGLIESIGARDAAEQARDMARDSRDAAIARAEKAESDLSELTATRDRLLAREHEDGRLHAQLRAELAELRAPKKHPSAPDRCPKCEWTNVGLVNFGAPGAPLWLCHGCAARTIAELRARPVLTEDLLRGALDAHGYAGLTRKLFAHLGPVTLPSPDRAEELCRRYHDSTSTIGIARGPAWSEYSDEGRAGRVSAMHKELTALAKLSPAPAPTFDAAFLRRVLVATKHGPGGRGNPGPCDAACVKCEAERMAKAAPAREVAPTLVAVSDEELATAYSVAHDQPIPRMAPLRDRTIAGIRAVRAKLGAAEVTEERLREAIREERHVSSFVAEDTAKGVLARLRATAAKGG